MDNRQQMEKEYLNIIEVTEYLGIKKSTLYFHVKNRTIPHYRIGRLIRFRKQAIDQWMEEQRQEVFDVKMKTKKVVRSIKRVVDPNVDRIVKRAVEEVNGKRYNVDHGKPDRIKGLRKEVKHGSL
jgi:excisionase family DNA binding protein